MKGILLAFALTLAPIPVPGFASPQVPPAVTRARGAFFALSVPNIDASVAWYSDKLGLNVVMRSSTPDKIQAAVLEGGGLVVELIQHPAAVPSPTRDNVHVHGIFKVGVLVDDYDTLLATLKARGVRIAFGPFPATADHRANVIVQDNNGNLIQFFGRTQRGG